MRAVEGASLKSSGAAVQQAIEAIQTGTATAMESNILLSTAELKTSAVEETAVVAAILVYTYVAIAAVKLVKT